MNQFTESVQTMIGRKVERINAVTTDSAVFTINSLSENRTGKLKNGESAPYVILKALEGNDQIEMHPEKASKLFKQGVESNLRVLADIAGIPEGSNTPTVTAATAVHAPEVKAVEAPSAPKAPSKKDLAVKIVKADIEAKVARKDTLTKLMSEVGLSKPGSATYYQNIKSGTAGWI